MFNYTVWVGGGEINATYLTFEQANNIANHWINLGYDEVVVEKVNIENS